MVSNIKGLSTENMIVQKKQFYTMIGIGQGGYLEELVSKLTLGSEEDDGKEESS